MQIIYTGETFPNKVTSSIFLAGPSPRSKDDPDWRPEALKILTQLKYEGTVFCPTYRTGPGGQKVDYDEQVQWEDTGLNKADVVVFWVPRDLVKAPAFTTNVEFGLWVRSGKSVYGRPPGAPKMTYLDDWATKEGCDIHTTLRGTLEDALLRVGTGALREGGETDVPLFLWNKQEFQQWYGAQKAQDNRLEGAKVSWTFRVGKKLERIFVWSLHVRVWIAREMRSKVNEVIILRPDISTVVAYCPDPRSTDKLDTQVCLVREFRSPVNNPDAMVWECPGGSSLKPGVNPNTTASEEMSEETGLQIAPERFRFVGVRQLASTLTTHRSHVFAVELTPVEIWQAQQEAGVAHGNHEDSEYTYLEVKTLREILSEGLVDWSMVGMIMSTVCK